MPVSVVRADYDALKSMSQAFGQGANDARESLKRLKSEMDVLQGGDWLGPGAMAFYGEMNGTVVPTMARLVKAMEEAQRVTLQINQIMKAAEDEAAGYLNQQGGAVGAGGSGPAAPATSGNQSSTGGGDPGGTVGSAAGMVLGAAVGLFAGGGPLGAAAGAAVGSVVGEAVGSVVGSVFGSGPGSGTVGGNTGAGNPLVVRDANALFSDGAMRGLIGSRPQGADTPALRSAMNELAQNPTGADLDRVLQSLADARGVPVADMRAQHERFTQVRAQAEAFRAANDGAAIPAVDASMHEEFMGSTPQLRFGQVVGDAFGIDPVFGAMLSPTGGMVGPGNAAYTPSNDSAIGYHGVVHDAAGYLYNYHGVGPGYDYLNREGLPRSFPGTGQVTGTRFWVEQIHPSTSPIFQVKDRAVDFYVGSVNTVRSLADNVRIF
jgi:WXG100 family type VII secretion target